MKDNQNIESYLVESLYPEPVYYIFRDVGNDVIEIKIELKDGILRSSHRLTDDELDYLLTAKKLKIVDKTMTREDIVLQLHFLGLSDIEIKDHTGIGWYVIRGIIYNYWENKINKATLK